MTRAPRLAASALAVGLAFGGLTAAPAQAHDGGPHAPPAPPNPLSDTGWQPGENLDPSPPIHACGSKVVLDEVDSTMAEARRRAGDVPVWAGANPEEGGAGPLGDADAV